MSAFLTGRQARKTHGADIKVGVSADQHVATVIGDKTRFPSLELGIERGGSAGNCDSGYSCAYSHNLSWRGESTPNAKEMDPKAVFDRLFSGTDPKELAEARAKPRAVQQERPRLRDGGREGAEQHARLRRPAEARRVPDGVREVEQQIEKAQAASKRAAPKPNMAAADRRSRRRSRTTSG